MSKVFLKYDSAVEDKLKNFPKYVHRRFLARFISRYELFKKIQEIKGSIIECGVHDGGGLMSWAKLSSIFEPYAIHRKIIGFDTFEGFPGISQKDRGKIKNKNLKLKGFDLQYDIMAELLECISDYDDNRYLNQFNKLELVKGDALKTIPEYLKKNKHLVIALLFLDFDLYEPSKTALKHFLPLIPKGGIIAFDEINNEGWPGETAALLETIGSLNKVKIEKFSFDSNISYIVI